MSEYKVELIMSSVDLARRICDCLSDGYDDEEFREETETALYNELSQIGNDSFIKAALLRLCERVEELENNKMVSITIYKDTVTLQEEDENLIEIKVPEECARRYAEEVCHADYEEWLNTYTADITEDLFSFVIMNDYKYELIGC